MSVRRHLTGPNALATVALFVALGGTSYAAVRLPKDSVGATQLRKNAVTSTKVKDRSLRRRDVSSAEMAALHGATGSIGATGARGPRGDQGDTSPFPAPGTLRSGEVVCGAFAAGEVVPFDQELTDAINLPVQAPVALDPVHVDVAGGVDDPGGVCTGSYADPTAAAGYACIYPSGATNAKNLQATVPGGMSTPLGFAVQYFGVATGPAELAGSWAYTAP
jgi:hypothetical protein